MTVRLIDEEPTIDYSKAQEALKFRATSEDTVRIEHVSLFPTKQAVAVFTALGYVLSVNLLLILVCAASFVLTYLKTDWPLLAIFNIFVVAPVVWLAYAKKMGL